MILNDIIENWTGITPQKRRQALQAIINYIDFENDDVDGELLYTLILEAANLESDDYFGTEGLTV